MRPRTFLITGGAGFIGSHLATALSERGDRVRILDDLSGGCRENLAHLEVGDPGSGAPVELFVGGIGQRKLLEQASAGVEGVLHEAAQVSVPESFDDPLRSYEINVMGTLGVLEAARRAGARRVVLAASSAAYGNPTSVPLSETAPVEPLSPYASGKLAAENLLAVWARSYPLETVALRYFNVYGPRQSDSSPYSGVIALFARALAGAGPDAGPITIFGDGEQTRDFIAVEDVARANLLALDAAVDPGEVFNVGTGRSVTLNELFKIMRELLGSDLQPDHGPGRTGDVRHSCASIERARTRLGFEPEIELRDGLERTLDWYRSRPKVAKA